MSEQRRHIRSMVAVDLIYAELGAPQSFAGTGTDLSVGGIFITTRAQLEAGTPIVLRMRPLLSHDELALQGTARWSNNIGFGVQFDPLGAKDTYILTEYLRGLRA